MAIATDELPPPGSSQLEVMFRRMLLQCSGRIQQCTESGNDDWRVDFKNHCILEVLQEKLYELEQSAADRPGPDILQQYKACVRAVSEELRQPDLPAYCIKATSRVGAVDASSTAARQRVGAFSNANTGAANADALLRSSRAQQTAVRDNGDISSVTANTSFAEPAAAPAAQPPKEPDDSREPSFTLSRSAQDKLQTQQRLQDDLTSELLDMGQELKVSTLAMQNAIRFRGKLLEDTEVSLVHSTANAQSVAAKAKQQYKQSSWNFCQTLLLLLTVAVIFCGMIVYIKLTSLVGLRGR